MADTRGFYKTDCSICNKETWHYKSASAQHGHCTNHSPWDPKRKHAKITENIGQGSLYNTRQLPTEYELRIANKLDRSLWQHAELVRRSSVVVDDDWAKGLFPDSVTSTVKDPDKVYCSFCGAETQRIDILTERKPVIRRVTEARRTDDGEVVMQERIISKTEEKHACPNCVLQIRKPVVVRRV